MGNDYDVAAAVAVAIVTGVVGVGVGGSGVGVGVGGDGGVGVVARVERTSSTAAKGTSVRPRSNTGLPPFMRAEVTVPSTTSVPLL